MLHVDGKRLGDAKRDGMKEFMFIDDLQVSNALQTYKRKGTLKKILRNQPQHLKETNYLLTLSQA